MREEIEEIRKALIQIDGLDEEARAALATLEAAIEEIELRPEILSGDDPEARQGLAGKWEELNKSISHWEEEHPSLVLAVGRISENLAVLGL